MKKDRGEKPFDFNLAAVELAGAQKPEILGIEDGAVWRPGAGTKISVAFIVSALLAGCFFATYAGVMSRQSYYDPSLRLDSWIAVKPGWIWVYLLYYPFCFVPLLFPGVLKDMRLLLKVAAGFLVQFAVALPLFYFFPTRIIHPDVLGAGLSARALRSLYAVDGGYCVFPSLHVANTLYVSLMSTRFVPKKASALLFLSFGLICAAILLVKQHFIADIPGGLLLGYTAYRLSGCL